METILNYLDNMFVNMPQTPEVLRAKEDLAEMMEDKYNELIAEGKMQNEAIGIVISEFGNIQELIDELGIQKEQERPSAQETEKSREKVNLNKEYAERETFEEEQKKQKEKEQEEREQYEREQHEREQREREQHERKQEKNTEQGYVRHVSDLEADEYLFAVKQASGKIAAGVFLCICSPVLLMLLAGIRAFLFRISDGIVVGLGLTVLLCMVACAVGLFITAGMKMEAYEYLKKECFILDPAYEQSLRNIWEMQKRSRLTFKITAGVVLCILSVVPVIVSAVIITEGGKNEFPVLLSVACLLVMIGIAVSMFITGGMEEESYQVILQEKEFSVRKKSGKKAEEVLAAIYWPVVILAYLSWSFFTGSWGITWILWPLAAIIYDVVCKAIDASAQEKEL